MSIKMFTVKCSIHGEMEITYRNADGSTECPTHCFVPVNGEPCRQTLQRIYDVPNVHYKGSGFYKTDNG